MNHHGNQAQSKFGGWRPLRALLGLTVGGLFLYLSLRNVNLPAVWTTLKALSPIWLLPLTLLLIAGFWLRSLRWWWMFPPRTSPTKREAFDAFMIGALGNNLLPGRLGDLLRGAVLGRHLPEVGTGGALASIILEKVLDGIVLLAMLALALTLAPLPSWLTTAGLWGIAAFGGALAALLVLSALGSSNRLADWAQRSRSARFIHILAQRLGNGLDGLRSPKRAATLTLFSVAVWGTETLILFLALRMFGLDLPPDAAVVTIVLLSVGTMLPAAPGFLGTYQFFVLTALTLYEVPEEAALAIGLVLNLLVVLVTTVTGMIAAFLEGGLADSFSVKRMPI